MRDASARGQTFVIALLVAVINRGAWKYAIAIVLVGADGAHANVGRAEHHAAIDRLSEKGVGHVAETGRVVASVVKRDIHVASDGINGKPVIEAIHRLRELIGHGMGNCPGETAIIGQGNEDVGHAGGSEIHPGASETPVVRPRRTVGIAGRVNKRATKQFSRNADIESGGFLRDRVLHIPGDAAIEGAIERDEIVFVIVPGHINFAVGSDERHSADPLAGTGRIVNASETKSRTGIRRASEVDATVSSIAPAGSIPSHVNTIAERACRIGVGGNHGLVIEVVRAALKSKQGELRIAHAAVGGTRHCHL